MCHRLFIAIVLVASLGACASSPRDEAPKTIRVLAYNIHHGEGLDDRLDLDRIAKVILAARPDVVALQEIDEGVRRTDGIDQMSRLAALTGMKPAFGPFFDYQGGRYGMGLLSRHPMTEVRNIRLPDGAEPRTALTATINIDGRAFVLSDIHLYRTGAERLAQARALLEALREEKRPVVLTGDFNSSPDEDVIEALQGSFTLIEKTSELKLTFPSDRPSKHIDHTMVSKGAGLRAISCEVLEEMVASDHRPILTVLEWTR